MRKITWLAMTSCLVVFISACATASTTHDFVHAQLPKFKRKMHNQVYGSVTQILAPSSYLSTGHDCLYKYTEEFLDANGNNLQDMSDVAVGDVILMLDSTECSMPKEPLIKLVGFTVEQYKESRSFLTNFLSGEYVNVSSASDAGDLFKLGARPTVITRNNSASYEFFFVTDDGFVIAEIEASNASSKPVLKSVRKWQ